MTNKKMLAIIPARGGSKGLPRKNILDLAGKPLIAWTIDACVGCEFIAKVLVSSDDEEILAAAVKHGAEALHRPTELASDTALSVPVMAHAVESLGDEIKAYDYVALMQPTSPLREAKHITEAFDLLNASDADACISVNNMVHSPLKSFFVQDGYLQGIVNNDYPFMRRQDLPATYQANGAIYIVDTQSFCRDLSLLSEKTIPYEMDVQSSIDIDTISDLLMAAQVIDARQLGD